MLKPGLILCLFLLHFEPTRAQKIYMLSIGNPSSLRGLCPVNDRIIWVSGSGGTVGVSTDGGIIWKWITVPHYEKTDFRDIEAFSETEAVIMGITDPAIILKTKDGGKTWVPVFQDTSRSLFLDAMDFTGDKGIVLGDPIHNRVFLAESDNKGDGWKEIISNNRPGPAYGEAFFAASGSNIKWLNEFQYAFVSGGKLSALYVDHQGKFALQLSQGKESTGANSIAVNPFDSNQGFVTGGDFSKDSIDSGNAVLIRFHPFHQQVPSNPPHGYRSCVEYISDKKLLTCGTSGVDISEDGGMNWQLINKRGFYVCRKAKSGNRIFLAGVKGTIACLVW